MMPSHLSKHRDLRDILLNLFRRDLQVTQVVENPSEAHFFKRAIFCYAVQPETASVSNLSVCREVSVEYHHCEFPGLGTGERSHFR